MVYCVAQATLNPSLSGLSSRPIDRRGLSIIGCFPKLRVLSLRPRSRRFRAVEVPKGFSQGKVLVGPLESTC